MSCDLLCFIVFTNNFITTLLGIFPHKIGGNFFHIGKITASILTPFSELLPNLHYSPIKKLENIFIFKIARQQHP
jgi:hypothetical protein